MSLDYEYLFNQIDKAKKKKPKKGYIPWNSPESKKLQEKFLKEQKDRETYTQGTGFTTADAKDKLVKEKPISEKLTRRAGRKRGRGKYTTRTEHDTRGKEVGTTITGTPRKVESTAEIRIQDLDETGTKKRVIDKKPVRGLDRKGTKRNYEKEKQRRQDKKDAKDKQEQQLKEGIDGVPGSHSTLSGSTADSRSNPKGRVVNIKIPKARGKRQFHSKQPETKTVTNLQPKDIKPDKPVSRKTQLRREEGASSSKKIGVDLDEMKERMQTANRKLQEERNTESVTSYGEFRKLDEEGHNARYKKYIADRKAAADKREADKKERESIDPKTGEKKGPKVKLTKPRKSRAKPEKPTTTDTTEEVSDDPEDYEDSNDDDDYEYGKDYKNLGKSFYKAWLEKKRDWDAEDKESKEMNRPIKCTSCGKTKPRILYENPLGRPFGICDECASPPAPGEPDPKWITDMQNDDDTDENPKTSKKSFYKAWLEKKDDWDKDEKKPDLAQYDRGGGKFCTNCGRKSKYPLWNPNDKKSDPRFSRGKDEGLCDNCFDERMDNSEGKDEFDYKTRKENKSFYKSWLEKKEETDSQKFERWVKEHPQPEHQEKKQTQIELALLLRQINEDAKKKKKERQERKERYDEETAATMREIEADISLPKVEVDGRNSATYKHPSAFGILQGGKETKMHDDHIRHRREAQGTISQENAETYKSWLKEKDAVSGKQSPTRKPTNNYVYTDDDESLPMTRQHPKVAIPRKHSPDNFQYAWEHTEGNPGYMETIDNSGRVSEERNATHERHNFLDRKEREEAKAKEPKYTISYSWNKETDKESAERRAREWNEERKKAEEDCPFCDDEKNLSREERWKDEDNMDEYTALMLAEHKKDPDAFHANISSATPEEQKKIDSAAMESGKADDEKLKAEIQDDDWRKPTATKPHEFDPNRHGSHVRNIMYPESKDECSVCGKTVEEHKGAKIEKPTRKPHKLQNYNPDSGKYDYEAKAEEGIGGMNMGSQRGLGHDAGYKQDPGQSAQVTEVIEEETKSAYQTDSQDESTDVEPNKQQIPASKPGTDVFKLYKKALIIKYKNIYKPHNL